jgi:hypothetical protein
VWGKTEVLYRALVGNVKEWRSLEHLLGRLKDDNKKDLNGPGWESID